MNKKIYERFEGGQVTQEMLREASQLFSENYGVWDEQATQLLGQVAEAGDISCFALVCASTKLSSGNRVRLSKERLRTNYLPENATCSYVRVTIDDQLAGNAFACRWTSNGKMICWVTQLVVHRDYRERRLAVGLLNELRQDVDNVFGLMSSHPAACLAAAKAFGSQSL